MASSYLEPTTACISLLSLPPLVVETVVGHASCSDKSALMRVCKVLRQAVLQQVPLLTLCIGWLGSDRSYREAAAVLYRRQPIGKLILDLKKQNCNPQQAQQLQSELAVAAGQAQRTCAVASLVVRGDISQCPGLLGALCSITALRFSGARIGPNTLQGLAQCTGLVRLFVSGCTYAEGVAPQHLPPCLPAVRDLQLIAVRGEAATHVHPWLPALAPQLTRLGYHDRRREGDLEDDEFQDEDDDEVEDEDDEVLAALARCVHLSEISLGHISQATLEVLLGLPSLTKVSCAAWGADAGGQRCNWQYFSCERPTASTVDALPRGIDTLTLSHLYLHTAATPAASLAASQAMVGTVLRACHRLCWGEGLDIEVITEEFPPSLEAECVAAALQGLAPLHPTLPNIKVQLILKQGSSSQVSEALVHALSAASSYTQRLDIWCATVAPGAWAALPAAFPAVRECSVIVRDAFSEGSIAALGALCRTPGQAHGCALRRIELYHAGTLVFRDETELNRLKQLQAELEGCGAPVRLLTGLDCFTA